MKIMIRQAYLDWSFDEDEHNNYRFVTKGIEHDLYPSARVELCRIGQPLRQRGIVLRVEDDGIVIHTDETLDITEYYSIALI